jgi:RNA polymerase sigma-70 factor, ECF subfamily
MSLPFDERKLTERLKADDENALTELIAECQFKLERYFTRIGVPPDDREDLIQQTFRDVWQQRATLRKERQWLFSIASRLAKDYLTHREESGFITSRQSLVCRRCGRPMGRESETNIPSLCLECEQADDLTPALSEQSSLLPSDEGGLGSSEKTAQAQAVADALNKLPVDYRQVVTLRHYEGLKIREIAEILQIPDGTVRSRMAQGLYILSDLLKADPRLATSNILSEAYLEFYVEPGSASKDALQRVFEALSRLHEAHGGNGLEFVEDGDFVQVRESVVA